MEKEQSEVEINREIFTQNTEDIITEITSNLRVEQVNIKRGFVKKIVEKLKNIK